MRGTDATGIAYNFAGRLRIYKRPLPAHKMRLHVPNGVSVIMGHTRMTTQGSEKHNQNNHPFAGKVAKKSFALAHNGVLWNDKALGLAEQLPETSVETDSYVAVQLIEKQNTLDFDSLQVMAEKVEGSFVFTVLDSEDSIWLSWAITRSACFTTTAFCCTHPLKKSCARRYTNCVLALQ